MNDIRRVGGVAGLLHTLALLGPVIVLPIAGLTHDDLALAAKALTHPVAMVFYSSFNVLWGATTLVLALALFRQLSGMRERTPVRVATGIGLLGGVLFIVQGAVGAIGIPIIASSYTQHPAMAAANLSTLESFTTDLLTVALVVYGIWLLIISWYAVKAKLFSRALHYIGFFWGIVAIIGFALLWILGPIWATWLGFSFLRASDTGAPASAAIADAPPQTTALQEP